MKYIKNYKSPLGNIVLESDGKFLTKLDFSCECEENDDLEIFARCKAWLDMYFNGEKPDFNIDYKLENISDFSKKVLEIVSKIPYGETMTYGEISKLISDRMSSQAVGSAVGKNPICIIIPCHRVIGFNNLGGYSKGMDKKIKLLEIEGIIGKNG